MSLRKTVEIIRKSRSFILSTHTNVEGDALGSELAMFLLLKRLRKRVYIYNIDKTPFNYKFLPSSSKIQVQPPSDKFDVGIILDCSDVSRLGKSKSAFFRARYLVNIDHHISNSRFGDINFVDPRASSVSELVFRIYKKFFPRIPGNVATCLYTGILTDTGCFTYSSVTPNLHRVVAELLASGISNSKIYHNIFTSFSPDDIAFIGKVLSGLKSDESKRLVWARANQWTDSLFGDLTESIFYNMRLIRDAEVFVLFKKISRSSIRVNFRSRGRIDVNKVAKFFGGGGHKNAAGATIQANRISSVEKDVITFIKKYL